MKGFSKKLLTYVLVALLALASLLWLLFESGAPKAMLISYIKDTVLENIGYDIDIEGLDLQLPLIANIDQITLSDSDGIFAEIDDFHINIVPSLGSLWTLNIWRLESRKVMIIRIPKPPAPEGKSNGQSNTPNIVINKLAIDELVLSPKVTNLEQDIALQINSYIDLGLIDNKSSFTFETKLLRSEFGFFQDAELELLANYNAKKELFSLRIAELKSEAINISSSAKINLKSNKVEGKLEYDSNLLERFLSDIQPKSTGKLTGSITLDGLLDKMHITSNSTVNMDLAGQDYYRFPELNWQTDSLLANGSLTGKLTLTQDIFTAAGNFSFQNGIFKIRNMKTASANSYKLLNLTYFADQTRVVADVDFKSTNLKELRNYLPFINSGDLAVKAKYDISPTKARLHLQANSKNFQSEFATLNKLNLAINSQNLFSKQYDELKLEAKNIFIDGLYLRSLDIASQSDGKTGTFNGLVTSEAPYPATINHKGELVWQKNGLTAHITKMDGKLNEAKLTLKKPITISSEFGKNFELLAPEITIDKGNMFINTVLKNQNVKSSVNWNGISAKPLYGFITKEFNNALFAGKLQFIGPLASPKLHGNIVVSNLMLRKGNHHGHIDSDIKLLNNKLSLSSGFYEQKQLLAKIDGKLPVQFSLAPYKAKLENDKPLFLNYETIQSFDFLSMIYLPVGHIIRGNLDGRFKVTGSFNNPILAGDLRLSKGKYSYKPIGLRSHNISAHISASGQTMTFKDIKIGDYFDNFITGHGRFSIGQDTPFQFNFNTAEFNLLNNPYLQGEVAGIIEIKGDNKEANAGGNVTFGPLEIKIPKRFQESVPELNVTKIIEENARIRKKKNIESYKLNLDLKAATTDMVWVRGWGVETQLKGDIHIVGSSEEPEMYGKLVSDHGKYEEFGKRLEIRRGELLFDGTLPPSPFLNIVGVLEEGSTELRLGLTGSILNPKINISSTPALSQEEALSMLLFGENPDNISAFQAFRLASSMRRLAGGDDSKLDPLEASTKAIGIDDINIKQDRRDPNKTAVGIGKHITDKFYLEIEQGAESGTATRIEVELTPKITLEGTTEDNGNNSLGINWKFDY